MRYIRSFSIYAFTLFFNAAVSFAGFSVLTHYLSEVDYGIINLYTSFTVFLVPFIAIGVPFVLSVDYFKMEVRAFREHFTNAVTIPVIASLLLTLLFILLVPFVQRLLKVNTFFAFVLPVSCLMIALNEIFIFLVRNKGKDFLYAGYSIGKNILEVGLALLLVVGAGYGWQGRIGGSLVALIGGTIVFAFLVQRWRLYTGRFRKQEIQAILTAGSPFIPERLAIFVLAYSDRFFIDHFNGIDDVGYYGAGAQIAMMLNMVIISLNNTFYPGLFKSLSQPDIDYHGLRNTILAFIGISLVIALLIIACIPLLFHYFIGPRFLPGQEYALYLIIGSFFWAIYNVFVAFLLYLKKNRYIMYISVFGMLLSLTVNFFSVRHFGAIGATYTNIIIYFLMALTTVYVVHKQYNLRKIFVSAVPAFRTAEK